MHESGEEWKPEVKSREFYEEHPEAVRPDDKSETVGIVCPRCGHTTPVGGVFCPNCGLPVNMQKATQSNNPFAQFARFKTEHPDLDGVKLSDYGNYIGGNQFYFLPKFLKFAKTGTKFSVNFSAFWFSYLYFFYRKMNILGIITVVLSILLSVPNAIIVLAQSGYINPAYANDTTLIVINGVFVFLMYALRFGIGFFANWLYFNKAKKDINKIRSEYHDDGQASMQIARAGGTNIFYCLIGVGIEFLAGLVLAAVLLPGALL